MPAGSGAFTGELGRQAGNRVRGRREEKREAKKRGRDTKREGGRHPPIEKNRMRQRKSETR